MIILPINQIKNGELQKEIDKQLEKLFENIHDEKTKVKEARTLTIKIKFTPQDDDRQEIEVESDISTKLASVTGVSTQVVTRRNPNTGQIEAKELKSSIPGQTYFDEETNLRNDVGDEVEWPN